MFGNASQLGRRWALAVTLLMGLAGGGCSSLRVPAIDPTGQSIFLPPPNYTTLSLHRDPVTGEKRKPCLDALHSHGGCFQQKPAFESPPAAPACETPPIMPNGQAGIVADTAPAEPVAPRVVVPGNCQTPTQAAQNANTGLLGKTRTPSNPEAVVTLSPAQQIAAVGSEVVLIGGVCGGKGYYRTREPLEWAISQNSVGHFVEPGMASVGKLGLRGHLGELFAEPLPELLSNNYVVACTSKKPQVLTRGTTLTTDDVIVEAGQAWVGVTSPSEGTTYVTLMAPDLDGWEQRQQTAIIHWVDGQWTLPPSAVVQGIQPHTLTTTVSRRIAGTPLAGWIVRYQILDPTALFAAGGNVQEVTTDASGQASIQIVPATPQGGMARVQVQVIRPAESGGLDRLVVGEGTSVVTWTTSQLSVRIDGPEALELNESATYSIEVSNPGTLAVNDVLVRTLMPAGFELLSTAPQAQTFGSRLDWAAGELGPGQRRVFEVTYRAARSGSARHCVSAQATGGTPIEDCLTTRVTADALFIEMVGPNPDLPLPVGQVIEYMVTITNRGDQPLTDVLVTDRFDPGLEHALGASPIERPIGRIDPGQSRQVSLSFRIAAEGRHCHSLEATATGTPPARTSACVTGQGPASTPPPPSGNNPPGSADLRVRKTGPKEMMEGQAADFYLLIQNTGTSPLFNLVISDQYDSEFEVTAVDPPESSYQQGTVTWRITRLNPGEEQTFQVRCNALFGNVRQACSRAIVRTADGLERTDQLCIPILPASTSSRTNNLSPVNSGGNSATASTPRGAVPLPGTDLSMNGSPNGSASSTAPLELTLDPRGERFRVGDQIEYLIVIRNNQAAIDSDVVLTIELPQQVKLLDYTGQVSAADHSNDWHTIRMTPLRTLRAGEAVEFGVRATVMKPGQLTARASVRSLRNPQGVIREHIAVASP